MAELVHFTSGASGFRRKGCNQQIKPQGQITDQVVVDFFCKKGKRKEKKKRKKKVINNDREAFKAQTRLLYQSASPTFV